MMNECDYLSALLEALAPQSPRDAVDAAEGFLQYLCFMRSEGYSDDEIAIRLGTPEAFARQARKQMNRSVRPHGRRLLMLFAASVVMLSMMLCLAALLIASGSIMSWLSSLLMHSAVAARYLWALFCASSAAMLAVAVMMAVLLAACRAAAGR